jgi:hypothetical protein
MKMFDFNRSAARFALCATLMGGFGTLLAGCQTVGAGAYEERYRIFQALDLGATIRPDDPPEVIAQKFGPTAAVNFAFEQLAQEGFTLHKMEGLPTGGGSTLFTFRRRIPEGYRPTIAPMEFTGLYQVENERPAPPTYYVFIPQLEGYTVHVFGPEGNNHTYQAEWTGQELRWEAGGRVNYVRLSGDGSWLSRWIDEAETGRRNTIVARRVRSLN